MMQHRAQLPGSRWVCERNTRARSGLKDASTKLLTGRATRVAVPARYLRSLTSTRSLRRRSARVGKPFLEHIGESRPVLVLDCLLCGLEEFRLGRPEIKPPENRDTIIRGRCGERSLVSTAI